MVVRLPVKQGVVGSSPAGGAHKSNVKTRTIINMYLLWSNYPCIIQFIELQIKLAASST